MKYNSLERIPKIRIQMLSPRDCVNIHTATEQLLARTGVVVDCEPARALLKKAGAMVDGDRVRILPGLVKQALNSVPDLIILHNREGNPAMVLGSDRCHFGTGSDTATTVDPDTGNMVSTTYETVARFTRFTDAMPHIDFVMSMGIAKDKGDASFVAQYAAMVKNTTKPIVFTAQGMPDMEAIYGIMKAAYGDENELRLRPRAMLYTEPIPPLRHTAKEIEMLMFCAKQGIPVTVPSGISAGASGPVTFAGALVMANAETLSALVIHQLVNPGAPYLYGGNVTMMDMRSGNFPYAAPEFHMGYAAFCDLARHYRMPVWGLAGASDSKQVDSQAGVEATYELLMAELSGSNVIHDVGYINSGLTSSMEMLLLCDEIISMVKHIAKGIEITDETLALDVIDQVGPMQQFLDHEHTVSHCRSAWSPKFFNREQFEVWAGAGRKDLGAVLREKVRTILAGHAVPELARPVAKKIDGIVAARGKIVAH
ncbi:MAG: trimethylamine methyltransferase family protein [Kiritimatiellae bacterium]|nr:trimethylamine methyltransferase family protein [Kiritimatiellia bacterium]